MSETTTPTPKKQLTVLVDKQGVQFGPNLWVSHEKIIGDSGSKIFEKNYLEWLNGEASAPVSQKVRELLQDIINPMGRIQRKAKESGMDVSSFAPQVANSTEYLKDLAREALTLLAPDTRTEYDKAVEALAPYLPDGWVVQSRVDGALMHFKSKPEIKTHNGDSWWTGKCVIVFEPKQCLLTIPAYEDWTKSLRHVVSGKVVPHV